MRIVNREEFLKLPANTVFSLYTPCNFGDLRIKVATQEYDFVFDDIIGAFDFENTGDFIDKCRSMERGASIPMDFACSQRDGLFDNCQLFAVFDPDDVVRLIERLKRCITPG